MRVNSNLASPDLRFDIAINYDTGQGSRVSDNKHQLRLRIRQRRHCMSPESRHRSSALLLQQLLAWPLFQGVTDLGCFLPMPDEVETEPIIEWAWSQGVRLAIPHWDTSSQSYGFVQLTRTTSIQRGAFGVREACNAEPVSMDALQMVLLPGQAFDALGNRLGRGKGHIDKMLVAFEGLRIGLCFDWQELPSVPSESHDIPMHCVFTPEGPLSDPSHLVLGDRSDTMQK